MRHPFGVYPCSFQQVAAGSHNVVGIFGIIPLRRAQLKVHLSSFSAQIQRHAAVVAGSEEAGGLGRNFFLLNDSSSAKPFISISSS